MDAFYGFQPIIIMDLLTEVFDALYIPFMDKKEQQNQGMKRLTICQEILARNVCKIQPSCATAF